MQYKKKAPGQRVKVTLLCFSFLSLYPLLSTGCRTGGYHIDDFPDSGKRVRLNRYIMKQKIWTLGNQFVIKDDTDTPVFYVKGKVFSIGDKLSFRDSSGKELVYISQKVFSFRPRYKIYRENVPFATIVKKLTLFKPKYIIDIPGPDDYKVIGDFWNYEYTITRNGREIAYISKKLFSWSDTYGIAIVRGEDDILILAAAVVIDLVSHQDEHHHFHISALKKQD
jgi:uncharacterized protein YxjI